MVIRLMQQISCSTLSSTVSFRIFWPYKECGEICVDRKVHLLSSFGWSVAPKDLVQLCGRWFGPRSRLVWHPWSQTHNTFIYLYICIIYYILYVHVYDYTSYTTYFFTAQSMIRACIYLHACIPRKLNHQLNWFVVVYTFPSKARAASCFPEFLKHLHGIWVFPYMVVPANTPKWSFLVGKPMVVGYIMT